MKDSEKKRPNIVKRGDKYYVYLKIRGKMKWFPAGTSIRKAEKKLVELKSERNNGTYKEIKKIKFRDFSLKWLESYVKTIAKPSTIRSYETIINRLNARFGSYQLEELSTDDLQRYVAERLNQKKRINNNNGSAPILIKPKTVCNEIVVLKRMFKHAVRWGYLKVNPAEYVERPRVETEEMEILNLEEIRLFLDQVTPKHKSFFLMAILTGMRRGELLGLQWGDIDWNRSQINVRQQLCNTSKQFITPKSRRSIRRIDMSPTLALELKWHKLASQNSELDLVYCNSDGKFLDPDNLIKREFIPALRRAKIRKVRFHDLRHTNVALRIEQDQNIKYIQNQLGHASIQTTLDKYGHLIKEVNTEQAIKLDEALGFVEHSGNLSEKDRQRIDNPAFAIKKGLTENRKSLIVNGSGERI